jgi:hypothetical protein
MAELLEEEEHAAGPKSQANRATNHRRGKIRARASDSSSSKSVPKLAVVVVLPLPLLC